jgi:oxalate decarboxylase/phosphoglucose isomerase-like protein (cupin superfamily)
MELTWIEIPNLLDPRGNLAVLENSKLPFAVKRLYYLYDVPSGSYRGGHAHKMLEQIIIPLSGSFELVLKNSSNEKVVLLNNPVKGVFIPRLTWRELRNFSSGSVCLVLASHEYDESDYIRDWQDFSNLI